MRYYPRVFNREEVRLWIAWNTENYRTYRHGLWAVILKSRGDFIGDCGITLQDIEGQKLPEVGYHIKKSHWNQGYPTEAAKACIEYVFTTLGFKTLYSYANRDNVASIRVAEKCGMRFVKHFRKLSIGTTVDDALYCIHR